MQKRGYLGLLILAVVAVGLSIAWVLLPVRQFLESTVRWVEEQDRLLALVLVAVVYTPAVLVFFPALFITLAAGALFGFIAVIPISIGSTTAACVAFAVGRKLARRWVEHKTSSSPRFRAIDRAVAEDGFRIVVLTRLSPLLPFTLLSYGYGLTRLRFPVYLLASWLGMLPGTFLYVYLGSAGRSIAELLSGDVGDSPWKMVLFYLGLVATILVVALVTRNAQRALRAALTEDKNDGLANGGKQ